MQMVFSFAVTFEHACRDTEGVTPYTAPPPPLPPPLPPP
jgi:hypothetical protein